MEAILHVAFIGGARQLATYTSLNLRRCVLLDGTWQCIQRDDEVTSMQQMGGPEGWVFAMDCCT
jgi:hypothetical protein